MVPSAKAPPDLRQRAQGQGLCKIHRDLARPHDSGDAPRENEIAAADIVAARNNPLDFVDLDLARLGRMDQVADLPLGKLERDRLTGELADREQPVHRAFEVAPVISDGLGDIGEHRSRRAHCSTTIKQRSNRWTIFVPSPGWHLRLTVAPPAADFVQRLSFSLLSQHPEISIDVTVERAFVDIVEGRFDAGSTARRARRARHDCRPHQR